METKEKARVTQLFIDMLRERTKEKSSWGRVELDRLINEVKFDWFIAITEEKCTTTT